MFLMCSQVYVFNVYSVKEIFSILYLPNSTVKGVREEREEVFFFMFGISLITQNYSTQ